MCLFHLHSSSAKRAERRGGGPEIGTTYWGSLANSCSISRSAAPELPRLRLGDNELRKCRVSSIGLCDVDGRHDYRVGLPARGLAVLKPFEGEVSVSVRGEGC